ncbi:MAG: DNA polymerase III subunit delta [Sphingobacteriia bacterium]|nr:DNA polymerase III subunit delta [Sphingobacteriia bacterium]
MEYKDIIRDIKNKIFYPVYFLTGEEPFFIDKISKLIETTVLSEDEKEFNQAIVYGRDVTISQIISMAKEYPVFGNYRVIIVREAQNLKNLDKDELLLSYLIKPVNTTLLVFDYKYKKLDGRTKIAGQIKKTGVLFESKKIYDNQVQTFIETMIQQLGFVISHQASLIMAENIGNDLSRIENEVKKLVINVNPAENITPDIVEKNIGISKEFNIFELQNALGCRDILKANRIVNYFASNPKDNPAAKVIIMLFQYFRKLFLYASLKNKSDQNAAAVLGVKQFFIKDYKIACANYNMSRIRQIIALLREYDQRSKGVDSAPTEDGEILKELVYKILH